MASGDVANTVSRVARLLRDANRILFVTGAGVSADSGLPTYRGVGGLYNRGDTEDGVAIEEALSRPMFARRPALTWKYLWQIGSACVGARPNAAHQLVARLEREKHDVWVITQNVDGLHRMAGSQNLVEVHGHAFDLYCTGCGRRYGAAELLDSYRGEPELPPRCEQCAGIIRPDVVLFEESLSAEVCEALQQLSTGEFDVALAVGTSALFPYIAAPIAATNARGKPTVEINPTDTAISHLASYRIKLSAADAAQKISAHLWPDDILNA